MVVAKVVGCCVTCVGQVTRRSQVIIADMMVCREMPYIMDTCLHYQQMIGDKRPFDNKSTWHCDGLILSENLTFYL
jgi:hypothetical protein